MGNIRFGARPVDQTPEIVDQENTGADSPWKSDVIEAVFETDPDVIAAVLPPPLSPPERPLVRANISWMDLGGFGIGTSVFSVAARHGEVEGEYVLSLPMTTEAAVVGGREIYGEPKKLADISLTKDGDQVVGAVTRMGVTFLELRGRVVEELPPTPTNEQIKFYFKFLLSPDGSGGGFDCPPSLVYGHMKIETHEIARVDGEVVLRDSQFDPLADIPVRKLVHMEYGVRSGGQDGVIMERVPGELLLPYVHQRYDSFQPIRPRAAAATV